MSFLLYRLLEDDNFRKRTAMYTGERKITVLMGFINGLVFGQQAANSRFTSKVFPDFGYFHDWVARCYNRSSSTLGWKNMILAECGGDEEKAVDAFFELFDAFRKVQAIRIWEAKLVRRNLDFHASPACRIQRNIGQRADRLPPADYLYLVQYSEYFDDFVYHIKDGRQLTHSRYASPEKAMEGVAQEYGEVDWAEVEALTTTHNGILNAQ